MSTHADDSVAASPLTVVFQRAGFGAATHVVNAVLLTAVLSATNSCFYASSRMLLSLARSGHAPRIFGWVNSRGVPVPALVYVSEPLLLFERANARAEWRSMDADPLSRSRL